MKPQIMLLAAVASLFGAGWPAVAQIAATGHITGRVTDVTGGVLPGVMVTVSGPGLREEAITDADGRFDVEGLLEGAPATYTVTAELAGFVTTTLDNLSFDPTRNVPVAVTMRVGCLDHVDHVFPGLAETFRQADAVVLLRVTSFTYIPRLKVPDHYCGPATEFVATVSENIKGEVPPPLTAVRFIVMDDSPSYGEAGDHIAFLVRDPSSRTYRILGLALIPVRSGWVESDYFSSAGIQTGPVSDVLAALRALNTRP